MILIISNVKYIIHINRFEIRFKFIYNLLNISMGMLSELLCDFIDLFVLEILYIWSVTEIPIKCIEVFFYYKNLMLLLFWFIFKLIFFNCLYIGKEILIVRRNNVYAMVWLLVVDKNVTSFDISIIFYNWQQSIIFYWKTIVPAGYYFI